MDLNKITFDIRGAAFEVYNNMGPGLLESEYEHALAKELNRMNHTVKQQVGLPFTYKDFDYNVGFRLDLLVDDKVIVEIKSAQICVSSA